MLDQYAPETTIAIDIGGTFTDIVVIKNGSSLFKSKVSSSFADPINGVMAGISDLLRDCGVERSEVGKIVHGTTVATNTILEFRGAATGLLTTAGFRDVLEIGRLRRPSLYDIGWTKPPPLVRRALRLELNERTLSDGEIESEIDLQQLRAAIDQLKSAGVVSVAVSLINSYVNPANERIVGEFARKEFPDLSISISSEIAPQIREYERTSTTVINAYIQPAVRAYLSNLLQGFSDLGLACPIHIMQSNGGMIEAQGAGELPVTIVESGPAAGVLAASYVSAQTGYGNLIPFDMGGTTAKASLIEAGQITISAEYEVGAGLNSGRRLLRGGGYPISVPSVDIAEVGSGGGSIAWVDGGGALRVGPKSAGAEPGPACHGNGGVEPTVTDANVVLGYMNPDMLAGGRLRIRKDLAVAAIEEKIARPLGMSVIEAAFGIHSIANANMIRAVRSVSIERGRDPREYVLMPFGGAGPIHGVGVANALRIPQVVVPISAGLFSAVGLHFADITRDFVRSVMVRLSNLSGADLPNQFEPLRAAAAEFLLSRDGSRAVNQTLLAADLRYAGQSHQITIAVEDADLRSVNPAAALVARFEAEHNRQYGYVSDRARIEIVNLRARVLQKGAKSVYAELIDGQDQNFHIGPSAHRPAYFGAELGMLNTAIYRGRRTLGVDQIVGPLIIEEMDTTILVPPGFAALVDPFGNVLIA